MFKLLKRHTYLFATTVLAMSAFLVIGIFLMENRSFGEKSLENLTTKHSTTLHLIRLALYSTLVGLWPVLLNRIDKGNPEKVNHNRYTVVLMIAITAYELVIVQRLPVRLYRMFSG